jgi:hypothetical protein
VCEACAGVGYEVKDKKEGIIKKKKEKYLYLSTAAESRGNAA